MNRIVGGLAAGFTCGFLCGFLLMFLVSTFSTHGHGVALYFEIPVICAIVGAVAGPFVLEKLGPQHPSDGDQDGKALQ